LLKTIRYISTTAISGLIVSLSVIALSPHGLIGTLAGIKLHSNLQLSRTDTSFLLVLKYWFFNPDSFFFGAGILLCLFMYIMFSMPVYKLNRTMVVSFLGFFLLSYLFYFFGFRAAPTSYNFSLFQPIAYALILFMLVKYSKSDVKKIETYRIITVIILLISLISPLRTTLLFFDHLHSEKTYDNARKIFNSNHKDSQFILVSGSMWSLSEDYQKMWIWDKKLKKSIPNECTDIILIQQEARHQYFVPDNANLIVDWRYLEKPKIWQLPLGNRPQGYGFSIWNIKNYTPNQDL
jgi:hypothetical protein